MSMTAPLILKEARKRHRLTQEQLAAILYVSVDQIKRFERGECVPEMDDVDTLEERLPEPGLFRRWARAQYPEIAKYFGESDERDFGLLGAVVNAKHQLGDVLAMQERVERDAVDGRIDDTALRIAYDRELREARQAIDALLDSIRERSD